MKKRDFAFSDGEKANVHEVSTADLDAFVETSELMNGEEFDIPAFNVFAKLFYPVLLTCTTNAPSLEESYKKSPNDIDRWFALCCELNPDWLAKQDYTEKTIKLNNKETVIKSRRPSIEMRLAQLQQEVNDGEALINAKDEMYRRGGWIGVAAASSGYVPTAYEARHNLSIGEFNLWHNTVKEMIPEWYATPEESAVKQTEEKKSDSTPDG